MVPHRITDFIRTMKKWIVRGLVAVVIVSVVIVVAIVLSLDSGIKKGVEFAGPKLAQVDVRLNSVSLSILSGSAKLEGLVVGNPEGYKTPSAISLGLASVSLSPGSLFSDKVVIKSININSPEITYETNLKQSNLGKILANLEAMAGPQDKKKEPSAAAEGGKKLQVDEITLSGGKIHVSITALQGKTLAVPLPTIHITGLGQGPEGITGAELAKIILTEIEKAAAKASSGSISDLGKQALGLGSDATKGTTDALNKATKGIGNLFKK